MSGKRRRLRAGSRKEIGSIAKEGQRNINTAQRDIRLIAAMLKLIETPGIRKRIKMALDDIAASTSRDLREAAAEMPQRRPGGPHRFGDPGNAVWDRLPGKGYYFGVSRAYVYQLMREGLVETALIKRPGKVRGIRLVWRPSMLTYIEKHRVGG